MKNKCDHTFLDCGLPILQTPCIHCGKTVLQIRDKDKVDQELKDIKKQAEIVRQRLEYHFRLVSGGFFVPKDMPFMKEFLNEVDKLVKLIEEQ